MYSGNNKPTLVLAGLDMKTENLRPTAQLLRIGLGLTRKCNLSCSYCLSNAGYGCEEYLTIDDYTSLLREAKSLGALTVVLIGEGEPLCYAWLDDIVRTAKTLNMDVVLFTNGTLLTSDHVDLLLEMEASVIVKINSLVPQVHDKLVGKAGAQKLALNALQMLIEKGFTDFEPTRLGVQTVILPQNREDIVDLWKFCRRKHMFPYFETLRRCGRAASSNGFIMEPMELRNVFAKLQAFDNQEFGYCWEPKPPYAGFSCRQHYFSCFVKANGDVTPCSGIPVTVGNVLKKSLGAILQKPLIKQLRSVHNHLKGKCGSCNHRTLCYGCRANALAEYGNIFGPDPDCWVNA